MGRPRFGGDLFYLLAGALLLILVYWMTLLPGVGYSGDTAKFQFLGKVLGTPHTTGYPTYLILNFLFLNIVPWGSPAVLSNLLSALFSVGACVSFFLFLRRLKVDPWISLASMLTLGFSPMFWTQSLVAEVYTLNALFLSLVFHQIAAWSEGGQRKRLWAAITIYALSFGNHLTMVTVFPALVVFVVITEPRVLRDSRTILWALASVAVGAGQYAYLLWRYHDPNTVFLEVMVPDLDHLWKVVSGAQFKPKMFSLSFDQVVTERIPLVGGFLWRELGLLLPIAGLGMFAFRMKRSSLLLIVALTGNLLFTLNYLIPDIDVYVIPAVLILVAFVALGFQFIWSRFSAGAKPGVAALSMLVPIWFFLGGYSEVGQQNNRQSAIEAEKILDGVGSNALLIGFGYHDFYYLTYYLIGEGLQAERNIYIMHHFRLGEVMEYFENDIPITLIDQRINTPTGLEVYVKNEKIVEKLKENGLVAEPTDLGLWRIERHSAEVISPR